MAFDFEKLFVYQNAVDFADQCAPRSSASSAACHFLEGDAALILWSSPQRRRLVRKGVAPPFIPFSVKAEFCDPSRQIREIQCGSVVLKQIPHIRSVDQTICLQLEHDQILATRHVAFGAPYHERNRPMNRRPQEVAVGDQQVDRDFIEPALGGEYELDKTVLAHAQIGGACRGLKPSLLNTSAKSSMDCGSSDTKRSTSLVNRA